MRIRMKAGFTVLASILLAVLLIVAMVGTMTAQASGGRWLAEARNDESPLLTGPANTAEAVTDDSDKPTLQTGGLASPPVVAPERLASLPNAYSMTAADATTPVSDDFSGCVLDESVWTFVDPLGDTSVALNGTQAVFTVPGGTAHDIWSDGPNSPRLMQFVEDEDFEIELKFDSALSQRTQLLGVFIEEDNEKHIKYNFQHDGSNYKIAAYTFTNGNPSVQVNDVIVVSPPYWLRVARVGDNWNLSYSDNGTTFTPAVAFDFPMEVKAVGPFVGNAGNNAPAVSGQVDYFFKTSEPIDPEDGSRSLTVEAIPPNGGSVTVEPTKDEYACGETVTLTAEAAPGFTFDSWGGALSGNNPVETIVMNKAETVTANFVSGTQYTLTTVPEGNGTINKTPDLASYPGGAQVKLEAIPDLGYQFNGWSGGVTGLTNPITINVITDTVVTGTFGLAPDRTLSLSAENGAVTANPPGPTYPNGQQVTLTATPNPGYTFNGWSGDLTGSDNPVVITMDADKSITALFATAGNFTLNTGVVGTGTVDVDPDKSEYGFGEGVELTATAGSGYAFVGWSGDLVSVDNPAFYTVTKDSNITATFGLDNQHALTVTPVGQGSVVKNPDRPLYADGQQVTLTAVPQPGYRFLEWSGDLIGPNNPAVIKMTKTTVISATFAEAIPVTLTTSALPEAGGTVLVDPVKTEYVTGDVITLTASAAPGYSFAGWSGDASGNNNPLENFVLDSDKNVIANFTTSMGPDSDDFNSCLLDPRWTFVDPNGLADYALTGTQAMITVPPGEDYNLWDQGNKSARLIQPAPNTDFWLEAKFETTPSQQFQIQGILVQESETDFMRFDFFHDGTELRVFAATVEGSFATKRKSEAIAPGDDLYLMVRRQGNAWRVWYGYDGENWTTIGSFKHQINVTAAGVFAGSNFRNNDQAPGYTAVVDYFFNTASPIVPEDLNQLGINIDVIGQGAVQRNPDKDTYVCGDLVTLTPQPAINWFFAGWSGDIQSSQPVQQVVVNDEIDLVATFLQGNAIFELFLPMITR